MSSCWRMATFHEMWPDCEMGVKRIPANPREAVRHKTRIESIGSGERTLKTDPGAPPTLHSLLEEVLALGGHAGDVVLLPLNGSVDILENLLDGVGDLVTNTVTGDEGDSVYTTILGGSLQGEINQVSKKYLGIPIEGYARV